MVGLFVVAAAVTAVAIPPGLLLGGRRASQPGMLRRDGDGPTDAPGGPDTRRTRRGWPRRQRTRPRPLTRSRSGRPAGHSGPPGASTDEPGTVRIVWMEGDAAGRPRARPRSMDCPSSSRRRLRPPGWTSSRRRAAQAKEVGDRARAPPAHRRGRPRGQPASQDRVHRRRRPHRPLPPDLRRSGHRVRARHRPRRRVPAHRP